MMAMAEAGHANTNGCRLGDLSLSGAVHNERCWDGDGEGDYRPRGTFRLLLDKLLRTTREVQPLLLAEKLEKVLLLRWSRECEGGVSSAED